MDWSELFSALLAIFIQLSVIVTIILLDMSLIKYLFFT